jgi:acetyl esterase
VSIGIAVVVASAAALLWVSGGGSNGDQGSGNPASGVTTSPIRLLSYGSDPLQQIKAYTAARPGSPLVVLVHGGSWHSVDHEFLPLEAADLNGAGFAVFDTNYRSFTSQGAFPHEINDVVAATRFAIAHAGAFHANPKDVTLIGGSAGGQLVASASQTLNAVPDTVARVVTLSAPTDFATLVRDGQSGVLAADGLSGVEQGLGCAAASCTPAQEVPWSPAQSVTASNCPSNWLIINGTNELIPADQADAMATALRAHGCHANVMLHDGSAHAFAAWPVVRDQVIAFVKGP